MTITVYKNTAARNVVDKTSFLTQLATFNAAEVKDICSITDPVIVLSNFTDALTGNYIYISDFNRYYYITKIETEHQRLIIYAHVDVLHTYKTEIRSMSAMLARVENDHFQKYLSDRAFKALAYKIATTMAFPKSFTKDMEFVLTLAGGGSNV